MTKHAFCMSTRRALVEINCLEARIAAEAAKEWNISLRTDQIDLQATIEVGNGLERIVIRIHHPGGTESTPRRQMCATMTIENDDRGQS